MIEERSSASWECYRIPGIFEADEWRRLIEEQLEADESPYDYDIQGQAVRIWLRDSPVTSVPESPHKCRNALRVQRVAFGGSRSDTLVGITIARVFFEEGVSIPSFRSATELFTKGRYPPVLRHETTIRGIEDLVSFLGQSEQLRDFQPHDRFDAIDLSKKIVYETCEGRRSLF